MEFRGFFPFTSIPVDSPRIAVKVGRDLEHTTQESQAIEVEVVEIDGLTAPIRNRPTEESPPPRPGPDWRRWPGRVTTLDAKWWPLWVLLGIIVLALLLTFGLVFGVIFVIFRVIKGILNSIFG